MPERLMLTKESTLATAVNSPMRRRTYRQRNVLTRMQDAWLALAEEQDWLDGELAPHKLKILSGSTAKIVEATILNDCEHRTHKH